MTARLGISVEGRSEAEFITLVLAPHLRAFGLEAAPIVVSTGWTADGCKAKGGGINLDRVRGEIRRLLESYRFVTTLYDFYGFGGRRPGETAVSLEGRIAEASGNSARLIAYVQLHEFEALLLSDAAIAADYFQSAKIEALIRTAVRRAGSPEHVNDTPQTAPSKRLEAWTQVDAPKLLRYRKSTKTTHGPRLAARITLPVMRRACPRFDAWVGRLEALSV